MILLSLALLPGCSSKTELPIGAAAYEVIPSPSDSPVSGDYTIGILDVLEVRVFQEPDLSFEMIPVDSSGNIMFPLIGSVQAAGLSSSELSAVISQRLSANYLVDPQVAVVVQKSASQRITVEGAVTKPGVFEIEGQTTLLQAVALAQGPTRTANLDEVIVFRSKSDGVYGAQFSLQDIRKGRAANPEILGNDIVVIGNSFAKSMFRDLLQLSPILTTVFIRL
ncbi:polysaccharide biosynthesis/export family protein [Parasphingorhabdus sp.]|uniref:polysaccharide biosynthesis/export family protein n=1 Tax=Parasphingorhabdus sp. TaxID=2709688 RepID=UPI003A8D7CC6